MNAPYVNNQNAGQLLANYFSVSLSQSLNLQPGQLTVQSVAPVTTGCVSKKKKKDNCNKENKEAAKRTNIIFSLTADQATMPGLVSTLTGAAYKAKTLQ